MEEKSALDVFEIQFSGQRSQEM